MSTQRSIKLADLSRKQRAALRREAAEKVVVVPRPRAAIVQRVVAVPAERPGAGLRVHGHADSGLRSGNTPSALAAYARVLLDPWSGWTDPARIPQRVAAHSSLFSIRQEYEVGTSVDTSTGKRESVMLFRGGIGSYFAATGYAAGAFAVQPHAFLESFDNIGTNQTLGLYTGPGFTIERNPTTAPQILRGYDCAPTMSDIQRLYVAHRPVSKAARVTYTGPKLTSAGKIAVALIPGDILISIQSAVADAFNMCSTANGKFQLTWSEIMSLLGATSFDAAAGCTITWVPQGDEIDEWRPTKYQPRTAFTGVTAPYSLATVTALAELPTGCSGILGADPTPYCLPCDGDPAAFKSMAELLTSAPAAERLLRIADVPANPAPPRLLSEIYLTIQRLLLTSSSADPVIVIFATDLPGDASFSVETIANYEAIADTRAFSAAAPPAQRTALHDGVATVRSLAAQMPRATAGDTRSILSRIALGIQKAVSAGRIIAKGAGEALPIAATTLRSMGLGVEAGVLDGMVTGGQATIESLAPLAEQLAAMAV